MKAAQFGLDLLFEKQRSVLPPFKPKG